MCTRLMKTFPLFPSIHHSAISSSIKRRVVTFGSTFVTFTVKWPILVSVYCMTASNSISVNLKHHILLTRMLLTSKPVFMSISHLLCYMPAVFGMIIWNILVSKLGCSENFTLSLRRNFSFGLRHLACQTMWVLLQQHAWL